METTTVTFQTTPQETEKAWLTFSSQSKRGRLYQKFAFPLFAIIIFLIFLNQQSSGTFEVAGQSSLLLRLFYPALIGLFFGWFISGAVKAARENSIIQELKELSPEYFGIVNVTFDQNELIIHAPLLKAQYNCRLLSSFFVTAEFLFICSGQGLNQKLVCWFPTKVLNNKTSDMISYVAERLSESDRKVVARSKTA